MEAQLPAERRIDRLRHGHKSHEVGRKSREDISNYERKWHWNTQKPQDGERNHTYAFEAPRPFIPQGRP
jgi:hypothetical protein